MGSKPSFASAFTTDCCADKTATDYAAWLVHDTIVHTQLF